MDELEWQLLEEKSDLVDIIVDGIELKVGDRVHLKPRAGGDIFDIALAGKVAIIESIEQDYENNVHLAVVLDDDPGKDMGMLRQPGHRFFFSATEVEPIVSSSDPHFRPADVETAPDGTIYFTDWQNPIIGHMQHNLRDPSRDKQHGRVYRVRYEGRELVKPVAIAGEPIEKLLDLLKA
ncbi:MAG: hypothetical protein ABJB40_04460, partial [Acidobacteriota bacterium]